MLSTLIAIPFIGAFLLFFVSPSNIPLIRAIAIWSSSIAFAYSTIFLVGFDKYTPHFQFVEKFSWVSETNFNFYLGIDGISLFLVLLTTFLIPVCILLGWSSVKNNLKEYMIAYLIMESLLIGVFCILDLLLFYLAFEAVLIPMFIIIGVWGSRERKIRAVYQFFLYTLLGSVFMLLGILYIYLEVGTTDVQMLFSSTKNFPVSVQLILWLSFFASFAVKIPMMPFHIWLPEAHVEAPTSGSVILAGVLLKLGGYGFIRFSLPMFPEATSFFTPLVLAMSVIAVIYASLTTIRQVDLKKIIAYSSVAHMNFVTLGIFSMNIQGIEGSILLMLSHGIVSSALFLCVGVVYDRHHTRLVKYFSGLVHTMPLFVTLFLLFTMANISLPGTSSFVGELLVLVGTFQKSTSACFLAAWKQLETKKREKDRLENERWKH
jgi:proton-translocating NADH-quinone oxidoreductase chain M